MSRKTVVIIGGGVGGMSAAQELAERSGQGVDFDIRVYEKHPKIPGGKARSLPVPGTGTDGRPDLPGEHGFRFIPGFYKHLPDSMAQIPVPGGRNAADNMVDTTQILIGRFSHAPLISISRFPRTLEGFKTLIAEFFDFGNTGLTKDDLDFFAHKLWQIVTSCQERRLAEYEKITWWDFVGAKGRSPAYQHFLADGLARSLTANNPHTGNSMTLGDIYVQLLLGMTEIHGASDRVLNAPTNEAWIDPWLSYLRTMGVDYTFGVVAKSIQCDGKTITGVTLRYDDGREETVTADYYIFGVPVEVMADLLSENKNNGNGTILKADPSLKGVIKLKPDVAWMNGLMFYLNQDVPIVHGHQLYVDSPWAITGISQIQFWQNGYDIRRHGKGDVRGILSTDISNWDAHGILDWEEPGIPGSDEHRKHKVKKSAKECTDTQIKDEVWAQIKKSLNVDGKTVLSDDMIVDWYLDPDIQYIKRGMESHHSIHTNSEPLLIHKRNTWGLRPQAHTRISNLFLASDYVQTYTDLACMEGANEAARRAVNSILKESGSKANPCKIWPLHEPDIFEPWRSADKKRFDKGLPWDGKLGGCLGFLGGRYENVSTDRIDDPKDPASLASDAYHFKYFDKAPRRFWYAEWWYLNFIDPTSGITGMVTYAVFNPGRRYLLGMSSLTMTCFVPAQGEVDPIIEYYGSGKLKPSYRKADVDLAGNTLTVVDKDTYRVQAEPKSHKGMTFDLTFTQADKPQFLAHNVHHTDPHWEISSWLAYMPSARVNGTVTLKGKRYELQNAIGYHDHDWGMWKVYKRKWSWAQFSIPDKQITFDLGIHAAFQRSAAYFRFGDLRINFPQSKFKFTQDKFKKWHLFWKYPTEMTFECEDDTGRYKLALSWVVDQSANLWKYPIIIFEQTARFKGHFYEKSGDTWNSVCEIDAPGWCEHTDPWF